MEEKNEGGGGGVVKTVSCVLGGEVGLDRPSNKEIGSALSD